MAPPAPPGAAAGPDELAPGPGREANKQGRAGEPRHRQCAGARLLSLAVQAAVMAAALAIFVLFAAASALLLLVLVLAARAFRHHRGSRYRVPSLDPPPPLRAGLSPADILRLPSFAFPSSSPSGNGGGDYDETADSASCAVCLEAARAGERWRAMPGCTHAFHAACVDRWLARTPACPVCRSAVAVPMS